MALYIIEVNDAGLRVADDRGILVESPGHALLQPDRLLLGDAARREARLHPRHGNTHFWSRLSTDPLPQPAPRARTHADLAYAHLLDTWSRVEGGSSDDEVIFAVPGRYDRGQLALLLGIARECPFQAVGLVDLAVAAAAVSGSSASTLLHLDAQLHSSLITRMGVGDEIVRERVDDVGATALLGLTDAMVGLIADAFIRETRFDPLHEAATEQRLYDRLPQWLEQLERAGEGLLELDTDRGTYRVAMHRDRLVERLQPRYRQLAERVRTLADGSGDLLLSARIAGLPGLPDLLRAQCPELRITTAADDAVCRGALAHAGAIRRDGERLAFITRLPNRVAPAEPVTAAAPPPQPEVLSERPTHVLVGHRAWPLAGGPLRIGGPAGDRVVALPGVTDLLCTVRLQDRGVRLDPEPGSRIERDREVVEQALHLTAGEEVELADGIRLLPIVLHEPGSS